MKVQDFNLSVSDPCLPQNDDKNSETNLKSSDQYINSEVFDKKPKLPMFDISLRAFWISYAVLILIGFVNVVTFYTSEKQDFVCYVYIVSIVFLIFFSYLAYKKPCKKRIVLLHILSNIHIIITDPTMYSSFHSLNIAYLSSLDLLLVLALIFMNVLERTYSTSVSVSFTFVSFGLLIHSHMMAACVLLKFFLLHTVIFFCFFYNRFKFLPNTSKEETNVTPLEEIIAKLHSTLNTLNGYAKNCSSCKEVVDFSTFSIGQVVEKLQTSKNIYSTRLEKITKNMDEEDKAFIEQNAYEYSLNSLEAIPNNMNRRTRSESIANITKLGGFLKQIGKDWNFNTFLLKECTENLPLEFSGLYIISRFKLDTVFLLEEEKLDHFLKKLEEKYHPNPYHNSSHGADVMNSYIYFMTNSDILLNSTDIELLAGILATLGHDVGHPAKNNRFLVTTKDPIAIQYNDLSVLENMHSMILFQLLQDSELLDHIQTETWVIFRKISIEMILATDMSKHFDLLESFKTKFSYNIDLNKSENRLEIFKIIIKASDIGHAAKSIDLHKKWCYLVIEEFFQQGDREKNLGLPISMYCDRENTNIGKSQAGFIKNIVMPLYFTLNLVLGSKIIEKVCISQLEDNKKYWESVSLLNRNQTSVDISEIQMLKRRNSMPLKEI